MDATTSDETLAYIHKNTRSLDDIYLYVTLKPYHTAKTGANVNGDIQGTLSTAARKKQCLTTEHNEKHTKYGHCKSCTPRQLSLNGPVTI